MLRLVAMANQNMVAACFEYEMATDTIRYRLFFDCASFDILPTTCDSDYGMENAGGLWFNV